MLALEDVRPDWLLVAPVPDVERVCDRGTIGHLETLRVATGWRCLEIGADSDRIAGWLHARVRPSGRVVSADLLPAHPFEPGGFDLVHARLVLTHLADRRAALASMVAALAPGGWLLVEDADWRIMAPPAPTGVDAVLRYAREAMERRGFDPCLGRRLTAMLAGAGLVDVGAAGRLLAEGGVWAREWRRLLLRVREEIVSGGVVSAAAFGEAIAWFERRRTESSTTLIAAWGRKKPSRRGLQLWLEEPAVSRQVGVGACGEVEAAGPPLPAVHL